MNYIKVVNGVHPNNTYLLYENNNCIIIDPSLQADIIDAVIIENGFKVCGILLTHAHYDHLYTVDYFVNKYNCDVYCSLQASTYLGDSSLNLSKTSNNSPGEVEVVAKPITVGEQFEVANFKFKVMYNPGHSMTCVTYFIDDLAFTGDFVFKGKIGRCDLFDSSLDMMYESLHKFMQLEKDFVILPGHGEQTTLFEEKAHNPHFIKVSKLYE